MLKPRILSLAKNVEMKYEMGSWDTRRRYRRIAKVIGICIGVLVAGVALIYN